MTKIYEWTPERIWETSKTIEEAVTRLYDLYRKSTVFMNKIIEFLDLEWETETLLPRNNFPYTETGYDRLWDTFYKHNDRFSELFDYLFTGKTEEELQQIFETVGMKYYLDKQSGSEEYVDLHAGQPIRDYAVTLDQIKHMS